MLRALQRWIGGAARPAPDRTAFAAAIARGNALLAQERPAEAAAAYREAAGIDPNDPTAQVNLGVALKEAGELDAAAASFERAQTLDPTLADPPLFLGQIAELRGDLGGAIDHLRRATAARRDFAYAWQELCRLYVLADDAPHAREAAYSGLAADRAAPMLHFYLGNLHQVAGELNDAVACYERAVALAGDFAEAHANLGQALLARRAFEPALASFDRAIAIAPDLADAHAGRGMALDHLSRLEEAVPALRRAQELDPANADPSTRLAEVLTRLRRFDEARLAATQGHAVHGDEARRLTDLGAVLMAEGRFEEAERHYRRALELQPGKHPALINLASTLDALHRDAESEVTYREALARRPGDATAQWNLGLLLLAQGRYAEAWPLHESRYAPDLARPVTTLPDWTHTPRWVGQDLGGKSIVVLGEQGLGDEIQFARYAALLKGRGAARVSIICRQPLKALFGTLPGVDAVFAQDEDSPLHDYWVFSMSLPALLGTTLDAMPAPVPYLRADPERLRHWAPRLPEAPRRVGLVWKGSRGHGNDANRSLPSLATLEPLWSLPDTALVSLQKGQGEDEVAAFRSHHPLTDLGPEIRDFADSAAIVSQLDTVICVDTSMAHLAGAVGAACWVLLPAVGCDWRWLREREDSPWYPGTARLFRQRVPGDWSPVVAEVARRLRELEPAGRG